MIWSAYEARANLKLVNILIACPRICTSWLTKIGQRRSGRDAPWAVLRGIEKMRNVFLPPDLFIDPIQTFPAGAKHYRLSSAGAFEEAILCAAPNTKHVSQCRSHKCQRGSGRGSNVGGARPCRHSSCWVVLASLKLRSVACFLIYFVSSYFVIHAHTSCVLKREGHLCRASVGNRPS
jgi:hypothetical protein